MPTIPEREAAVFMRTGVRVPITLVRGEGTRVWDDEGNAYLDFVAGIATDALGHAHPAMVRTITEQASKLIHVSNIFYTEPQIDLAELLLRESGLATAYFVNSGAEANEAAIKLARKWGREQRDGSFEIVTAANAFHGRTLATVTATGNPRYMDPFAPLPGGFTHVPFDDLSALAGAIGDTTCAVMLETVQGEGGVNVPGPDYIPGVRKLCDERNVLLILDEVQTGIGRTGKFFGFQHYDIRPDIMTLAKGLGGGVPVAAVLANAKASVFEPGDHGSTFAGQPLTTAVALTVCQTILDEDLAGAAATKGEHLRRRLAQLEDTQPEVAEVRGQGLLVALGLKSDIAPNVVAAARERGLLCNNVRPNAVRLMPPLTVSEEELDQAVAILEESLEAVAAATA